MAAGGDFIPEVVTADNLAWMAGQPSGRFALVVADVPFNTGRRQERVRTDGTPSYGFDDAYGDLAGWLRPRMAEARRILRGDGSLFLWVDCREAHYCKVMLDGVFGRASFVNEIIWAYDYGARSKTRWSAKHDTIFWYAKDPRRYVFNYGAIDRIPYMSPERQTAERASLGKTPTDVWWHTIVPTNGREKTGYATQKPLAILERIVRVHTNAGDEVCDIFAGSGTTGEAAARNGRRSVMVDVSPDAAEVMARRFAKLTEAEDCR